MNVRVVLLCLVNLCCFATVVYGIPSPMNTHAQADPGPPNVDMRTRVPAPHNDPPVIAGPPVRNTLRTTAGTPIDTKCHDLQNSCQSTTEGFLLLLASTSTSQSCPCSPSWLTFRFTDSDCLSTTNLQGEKNTNNVCSTFGSISALSHISVTSKDVRVVAPSPLTFGDSITIVAIGPNRNLGPKIDLTLDVAGSKSQNIIIKTSCSGAARLTVGDVFGALSLTAFSSCDDLPPNSIAELSHFATQLQSMPFSSAANCSAYLECMQPEDCALSLAKCLNDGVCTDTFQTAVQQWQGSSATSSNSDLLRLLASFTCDQSLREMFSNLLLGSTNAAAENFLDCVSPPTSTPTPTPQELVFSSQSTPITLTKSIGEVGPDMSLLACVQLTTTPSSPSSIIDNSLTTSAPCIHWGLDVSSQRFSFSYTPTTTTTTTTLTSKPVPSFFDLQQRHAVGMTTQFHKSCSPACRPRAISFMFVAGTDCSASRNSQHPAQAQCVSVPTGGSLSGGSVGVAVGGGGITAIPSLVGDGEVVRVIGPKGGVLGPHTEIELNDGSTKQYISLTTSCTEPLSIGDLFGSLRVVAIDIDTSACEAAAAAENMGMGMGMGMGIVGPQPPTNGVIGNLVVSWFVAGALYDEVAVAVTDLESLPITCPSGATVIGAGMSAEVIDFDLYLSSLSQSEMITESSTLCSAVTPTFSLVMTSSNSLDPASAHIGDTLFLTLTAHTPISRPTVTCNTVQVTMLTPAPLKHSQNKHEKTGENVVFAAAWEGSLAVTIELYVNGNAVTPVQCVVSDYEDQSGVDGLTWYSSEHSGTGVVIGNIITHSSSATYCFWTSGPNRYLADYDDTISVSISSDGILRQPTVVCEDSTISMPMTISSTANCTHTASNECGDWLFVSSVIEVEQMKEAAIACYVVAEDLEGVAVTTKLRPECVPAIPYGPLPLELLSWSFTDSGSTYSPDGATRSYTLYDIETGAISHPAWSFTSPTSLRWGMEDSVDCLGDNPYTQKGTARLTLTIPTPRHYLLHARGKVEQQSTGFEFAGLVIDGELIAETSSIGAGIFCESALLAHRTVTGTLAIGTHTIEIDTTTGDAVDQLGAYYEFDFQIGASMSPSASPNISPSASPSPTNVPTVNCKENPELCTCADNPCVNSQVHGPVSADYYYFMDPNFYGPMSKYQVQNTIGIFFNSSDASASDPLDDGPHCTDSPNSDGSITVPFTCHCRTLVTFATHDSNPLPAYFIGAEYTSQSDWPVSPNDYLVKLVDVGFTGLYCDIGL